LWWEPVSSLVSLKGLPCLYLHAALHKGRLWLVYEVQVVASVVWLYRSSVNQYRFLIQPIW
jgi:hypothetical protein